MSSKACKWEGFLRSKWRNPHWTNSTSSRLMCFFVLVVRCCLRVSSRQGSIRAGWFWKSAIFQEPDPRDREREYHPRTDLHPKEITSDSLKLCETEVLFPAHPTCTNKCSIYEDTQNSTRGWFRIFKVPRKVWVLEQIPGDNAVLYHHMTILCLWSQRLSPALVHFETACASFVYRPKKVQSTNSGEILALRILVALQWHPLLCGRHSRCCEPCSVNYCKRARIVFHLCHLGAQPSLWII